MQEKFAGNKWAVIYSLFAMMAIGLVVPDVNAETRAACELKKNGYLKGTLSDQKDAYDLILEYKKKWSDFDSGGAMTKLNGELKRDADDGDKKYKNEINANIKAKKSEQVLEGLCEKWQASLKDLRANAKKHREAVALAGDDRLKSASRSVVNEMTTCRKDLSTKRATTLKKIQDLANDAKAVNVPLKLTDYPNYKLLVGYSKELEEFEKFTLESPPTKSDVAKCTSTLKKASDAATGLDVAYETEKTQVNAAEKKKAEETAKKAQDAQKQKEAADAAAKSKAAAEAEAAKKKEAAGAASAEVKKCVDDWRARLTAAGVKLEGYQKDGTATQKDVDSYKSSHAKATDEVAAMIKTPPTLAVCKQPTTHFTAIEKLFTDLEKRRQDNLAKAAAEKARLEAAQDAEYKKWLERNPKDINGACNAGCKIRHGGDGPKQQACAKECTVAKNAVVSAVNTAIDTAFMKPLETALDKIGVSKALCEAATSTVGEQLAKATKVVGDVSSKVTEKSTQACPGTSAKCTYVARLFKTSLDAKACSDASKSLTKSRDAAQKQIDTHKKLIADQKAKATKGDKSQDSAFTEALKNAASERTEMCESVKAEELIKALVKPCVSAAEGAAWLLSNAKDYGK